METALQKPHINVDYFEDLTGDIFAPASLGIEEIGIRIKTIREEKGISLQDLSKLTGFDVEALSDIEANRFQPQLGTIIKLSKALDSAFGRIVSGVGSKLYSVTRKNERKTISRSTSYRGQKPVYLYKSLAPEVKGRHMESLIVQLEENPDAEMSVHEGEEFIYVLDGVASLKIGADVFELEAGDSVYYLSTTPHLIAAKSGKATILAVIYEG
ncbi:MAG: XRE family transcriptional regulator [Deltaproteobacteria bacterium]|jgi:transcriptional regulator with XRE-family HTH domain